MKVYMNNSKIDRTQVGENNTLIITSEKSVNDWDELLQILEKSMGQLDKKSNEYKLAEQVQQYAKKKDKKGLKNLLENKNNMIMFVQNILGEVVSAGVYDLIKKL